MSTVAYGVAQEADLSTSSVEGGVAVTGYGGPGVGEVELPATIGGQPVVEIGPGAFWGCEELTRLVLPSTVTSVGDNAFTGCTALESVIAPGLRTMGDYAFYQCPSLAELTVSGSMRYAGEAALGETPVQLSTPVAEGMNGWVHSYTLLKRQFPALRYGQVGETKVDDEAILLYSMLPSYLETGRPLWGEAAITAQRGSATVTCTDLADYTAQLSRKGLTPLLWPSTQALLNTRCQAMLAQLEQSVQRLEEEVATP